MKVVVQRVSVQHMLRPGYVSLEYVVEDLLLLECHLLGSELGFIDVACRCLGVSDLHKVTLVARDVVGLREFV